jgi:DNA gyrase inhibitor GyrI
MENVRRAPLKARKVSVSRTVGLTKPRTLKQRTRRFLAWRKHK